MQDDRYQNEGRGDQGRYGDQQGQQQPPPQEGPPQGGQQQPPAQQGGRPPQQQQRPPPRGQYPRQPPRRQKPFYKKPLFIGLIIAVVVAIVLASVFFAFMGDEDEGSSEKNEFLYTWEISDTSGTTGTSAELTFYANGTYKASYYGTQWLNWSLNADENNITLNEITYNYEFSNAGDTLELSNENEVVTLQKQNSEEETSDGTSDEKDKFLYTWEVIDSNTTGDITGATYTFYDNGTYNFQYSNTDGWGDWSLDADANTITIDGSRVDYSFSNGDNTLELSDENTKLTLQKQ